MSFLNPLFLLGLAAVMAPIIVHLVRRTNAKRVEFPSLMFVRRVPQRTIRRRKLHNLLLLALRCLALLLLVMAFARPYFSGGEAAGAKDRATVILLDQSFSTRYGNRFEQIKSKAKEVINRASNEKLSLVTFGQSYEVLSRFSTESAKTLATVDMLEPGLSGSDYVQALRGAESLLKDSAVKNQRVVLISDFQAIGFNQADVAYRLNKDIQLDTIDVGESDAPNLAVTDLSAQPVIYQPEYTDKLAARIANFSDEDRDSVRIEFQLNERTVEKREIRILARESSLVEFTGFNLSDGTNRAVILIDDAQDKLQTDNKFYFTLKRATQSKALIIESAVRGRSESLYLRNALTTGENLPFTVTVKTAGSVNPGELSEYRVIIVNDAGDISSALADGLKKFTEQGGGLIISAGRHTDTASFNQSYQNFSPATLQSVAEGRLASVSMSEIKGDHPVFEIFRQSGRLSLARVYGWHRVQANEKASVLARFEDGSPALIEGAAGNGKVLLFTTTFDSAWNDLPLTPTYLPLVRQMVRYIGEREEKAWNQLGLPFTVLKAADGSVPAADTPSEKRITERQLTANGDLIVNAREAGFYKLRYGTQTDYAAVNVDAGESDLSKLDLTQFTAAVTGADPTATSAATTTTASPDKEEIESRQRVWWILLIASLLLFIAEAILARRTKMAKLIG